MRSLFVLSCLVYSLNLSAQQVPEKSGSAVPLADAQAALDHHNKARKEVGVAPLQWSAEMAAFAQEWADHLAAADCKPRHRPGSGTWKQQYGENIFWGSNPKFTAVHASEGWYSEIKDYDKGPIRQEQIMKTGHYTQMVWHNTTHVGFGMATCKSGAVIIVANYSPAGNFLGQKPY